MRRGRGGKAVGKAVESDREARGEGGARSWKEWEAVGRNVEEVVEKIVLIYGNIGNIHDNYS